MASRVLLRAGSNAIKRAFRGCSFPAANRWSSIFPFSRAALDADTRAYARLMEHPKAVDTEHTVIMMQLENEVGMAGDSRDRGAAGVNRADDHLVARHP